ncbi:NAD(P)-binding protein [Rhizoclosmatium globosum]|uniref:D-xylose 1-dehydrogenase (NADP(+), D-xylono-1,5-lactone-forming) n=1 Tax=Rhizoclosmatium globosum TaxID=329046 RepID=A0A1Y2CWQ7_9FUNG|nr:NAD(P)-binding protein [Rhizoclosmatium globosum]|eukprot:ORY51473.1 NAD(P)-binding protein [Rhizoclosmatium globosum]
MGLVQSVLATAKPKDANAIRFGILGAANIAPMACTGPLKHLSGGVAHAIAARDRTKAQAFAKRHGIPNVFDTYEAVLADPDIDAIFIPLPNGLHAEWAIKAIKAGKHVLCEKPISSNAAQAKEIKSALDAYNSSHPQAPLVFSEAFHWKCHPLAKYIESCLLGNVEGWDVGTVEDVKSNLCLGSWMGVVFPESDIRYNFQLAGGSLMDLAYVVSMSRWVNEVDAVRQLMENEAKGKELETVHVEYQQRILAATFPVWEKDDRIDVDSTATLRYPSGSTATIHCGLNTDGVRLGDASLRIKGSRGTLSVFNPVLPFLYHTVTFEGTDGKQLSTTVYTDKEGKAQTTYFYQMKAFLDAVQSKKANFHSSGLTCIEDGIMNMKVVDALYENAGMPLRP